MNISRCLAAACVFVVATLMSGCGSDRPTSQQTPPPAAVNPTAAFSAPAIATVFDAVPLDATASMSADGSALQYVWDFWRRSARRR